VYDFVLLHLIVHVNCFGCQFHNFQQSKFWLNLGMRAKILDGPILVFQQILYNKRSPSPPLNPFHFCGGPLQIFFLFHSFAKTNFYRTSRTRGLFGGHPLFKLMPTCPEDSSCYVNYHGGKAFLFEFFTYSFSDYRDGR